MIFKQKTITKELTFEGIGVHSGTKTKIVLAPAQENTGINFIKNNIIIPLLDSDIDSTLFCTTIKKNALSIKTVEHLLSAINGLGISNLNIYLEGDEIPILDGSSLLFVEKLKELLQEQNFEREVLAPQEEVYLKFKDKFIFAKPSKNLIIKYIIDYPNTPLGFKYEKFTYSIDNYIADICFARTYGFFKDAEFLRKKGLALGSSLENTLVIGDKEYLNEPRHYNEPIKHKILDLIGDLTFLGKFLQAEIIAYKTGHQEHLELVKRLLNF